MLSACGGPAPFAGDSPSRPQLFAPGMVSTELREYGIAFTPDGREAYFTRRGRRGSPQIFMSRFEEGRWAEAELASFSGEGDEAPFITADGERMLFSSRRSLPVSQDRSSNIWEVVRTGDGWSEPAPIAGAVNQQGKEVDEYSTGRELSAVLLASGALLYATGTDPEWGDDLYVAEPDESGAFVDARPLRINSYGDESSPVISPDGRYLVFQGYRGDEGLGEQDLYASQRTEYGWSEPRPLPPPVNSDRNDGYPSFSPGGRLFFFASDRDARGGYYSIYYVAVETLGLANGQR